MIRNWPTAAVLIAALTLMAATLIAGFAFEIDFRDVALLMGGEGGAGAVLLAFMRSVRGEPSGRHSPPPLPVLLVAIAVSSSLTSGCGAAWLDAHTPIVQAGQTVQIQSEPVIRQLRLAAIERAVREAHAGGATRAEAEAVRARVERDWQCPLAAHRGFGTLVSSYVDGLWLAERTGQEPAGGDGDGELGIMDFVPFARRLVDGYRAIAQCANTLSPGQLPVPAFLDLLPPTWGIDIGDREEADRG